MKISIFLACSLLSSTALFAQNWTGAINSDWNNPANWSTTPGNGDDIEIDPVNYTGAMANPVIAVNSTFSPAGMLVQNGAQLTISANLDASGRVEILGSGTSVTMTGGTFSLTGGGNNARLIFAEDAHLQMEGGNLTVDQRLLFELGASGQINAGSVTVGETIALVDGSILASSKLVQNGGTITVNAEFGFENEAGLYYPVFEQTGGTLQINGALLFLGATPGSGRGYFRSTGGTVRVTGSIGNDPASTMGMQIELSGEDALFENLGASVDALAGDSIVIVNGAEWHDVNTVSWQNDGVFHAFNNGLFQSGNTTLSGAGSYQFNQVKIPALKLMNHVLPAMIAVSGNLEVEGVFNPNSNRLQLNGELQQEVNASGAGLNLYSLEIKNAANGPGDGGYGVNFLNHLNINHDLLLADGILSSATASVKLADGATVGGGTDTTFVDAYMEKTGDDAVLFPLGAIPDRYRPLSVSAPATLSTLIRVAYKFSPYSNLTPVEIPLLSVSGIEYWDLSRTGSSDLFSAAIAWNNASQSGLVNCNDISMAVWDGNQWDFTASTTTGLCNGTGAGTLSSSSSLAAIGPLTIGFTENVNQNPVEVCAGESVTVGANTYTNSGVYMDVLEDIHGDDSTVVTILTVLETIEITVIDNNTQLVANAAGATSYQWLDCNNLFSPISGETNAEFYPTVNGSYAVIVSRDACSDTSACVLVDQIGLEEALVEKIKLYPNPLKEGGNLVIDVPFQVDFIEVCSLDGRILLTHLLKTGDSKTSLALPGLTSGAYLLRLNTSAKSSIVKRFVVQ